jgi:hypothetical protein
MNPLGLVIVTEYTSELPPHPSLVNRRNRNTQMFLDGRERRESEGPVIVIVQPDLRREVWFHTPTRTFTVRPIFELATPEEWRQWSKRGKRYNRQHAIRDQERVTYDVFIHTEKMNETTELFGFPARHYVTHRRDVYPESTHKEHESVSDGWYLDFLHPAMPEPSRLHKPGVVCSGNERPVIHRTGETPFSGLPAKVVRPGGRHILRRRAGGNTPPNTSWKSSVLLNSYLIRFCSRFRKVIASGPYFQVCGVMSQSNFKQ